MRRKRFTFMDMSKEWTKARVANKFYSIKKTKMYTSDGSRKYKVPGKEDENRRSAKVSAVNDLTGGGGGISAERSLERRRINNQEKKFKTNSEFKLGFCLIN